MSIRQYYYGDVFSGQVDLAYDRYNGRVLQQNIIVRKERRIWRIQKK